MGRVLLVIVGLLAFSCNAIIECDKTVVRNELLYKSESNDLVDGVVVDYYPDGSVSSESLYRKGIMDGEYTIYDHQGGVVQKGERIREGPIIDHYTQVFDTSVDRIEVDKYVEGEYSIVDLYLTVDTVGSNNLYHDLKNIRLYFDDTTITQRLILLRAGDREIIPMNHNN